VCYEIGTNIAMLSKILSSIFNKLYVRFWPKIASHQGLMSVSFTP
jgi:hypothetical protein